MTQGKEAEQQSYRDPEGAPRETAVLRREWAEFRADRDLLTTAGIVEIAVRNPNVMEYMRHWERRAEAAEAERDALSEALAFYTCECDPMPNSECAGGDIADCGYRARAALNREAE